jgi:hypothetical protein
MAVDPLVIMAIYIHIHSDLDFPGICQWAHEYLLSQPDPINHKVSVQMDLLLNQ